MSCPEKLKCLIADPIVVVYMNNINRLSDMFHSGFVFI